MAAMMSYDWPGNVRELQNRIIRAVVMTESLTIAPADLSFAVDESALKASSLGIARGIVEQETILAALHRTSWNPGESAKLLGVSRATFYRLLARYRIAMSSRQTVSELQSAGGTLGLRVESA
jgi:two-component system NtrC family response regulator